MTPATLALLLPVFWGISMFLALKMDGTKIEFKIEKKSQYGIRKAINLPLHQHTLTTAIFIGKLRIDLTNKYPDITKTQTYRDIFNQ